VNKSQTNRLLGYPEDARLLIINADDFGMCQATNEAIFRTLNNGLVRSTSLMAPCPWSMHAIQFLEDNPDIPFGVHLTAICDSDVYKWGPITSREKIPSLVDKAGHFYRPDDFPKFLDQVNLDQLETEFRAQIEFVLETNLKPSHLDWHYLRINGRPDIFDLMLGLAKEYGLAQRVISRSQIKKVQSQGLPASDFEMLDSSMLDPVGKSARYAQLLRELPEGLSEWAVHPGLDTTELLAMEPGGNHFRQTDFDFLMSQEGKEIVEEEGIILVDYHLIQKVWNEL
jgi:predicted glycoside hydrolase/deacetylase ChbG (UPF0249 family)